MDRARKAETIETLRGVFASAGAVVVTHYLGLTVAQLNDLRDRLRREGATFKVVKNRLAQKALNGAGDGAHAFFSGPVGIAYGADPVGAAKVAAAYAKEHEQLVLIGAMMGPEVLDAKAVEALAKLPSLDQLRAKIVGLLNAPATRVASVLQAPAGQLARVMNAYAQKEAA
ncbi:MAG TPA: 50S ribosomal protein L10 [Caulobacteraceae bacterium]|nr:50S ribosomal protein L10 [Caulobacteraceae bacterium]